MGFLDDIVAQQNGGGMLGGLPASWQYTNPESLTSVQKQMMGLVGTQNPEQAGFNPLPASTGAFPSGGAAPIAGTNNPFGMLPPSPAPAPAAASYPQGDDPMTAGNSPSPMFGAGASPVLFANPPGATPGNPALPAAAPPIAADDSEEDPPTANAPASPLAIGGYQMPRIGPSASFAPNPVDLPTNAQPAQGQGLPGPAAPPAGTGYQGFMNRVADGLQSISKGGSFLGAVRGQYDDPGRKAADVGNMTARALIAKGVDPSVAIAAIQPGNAEMLKTLVTHTFGPQTVQALGSGYIADKNGKVSRAYEPDEKFQHVTHKNNDGSESLLTFDPSTGKYTSAPSTGSLRSAVDPDSTGPERMAALTKADPNYARKIQSMVNGDIPMPSGGQASRSPQAARMIEDVLAVDGSTSASDFATRAATRRDYASGMASRVTKSLNTTIEHAQRLDESIDKLGNHTWFPSITNYLHDKRAGNTDSEYQKARSEFESNKEAFIKELDFTLSGGHSSVSGSAELRDKINRADSPESLHAAIKADLHLLSARLDSHTTGFNQGTRSQRDGQDFLYPKNRAAFNKLMGSKDTSTGGAVPGVDNTPAMSSAAPAAPPAPGAYVWSPDKGLAAVK
jgi:hypothetical protein